MAVCNKYGKLDIPGIREDEPVFIIRAQDNLALEATDAYAALASEAGCNGVLLETVKASQDQIGIWQTRNGTKLPD